MKNLVRIALAASLLGGVAEKTQAQSWNVTGNAGTDPNVQFIGTTDSKAFKIRTNNVVRMMIKSNGDVGVGTQSPTSKLHVNGVITATGGTSNNWNTAYSWGNHALAGYLTSFTEQDPQVGINTTNYIPRWNGTALETSNLFNSGTNFGFNTNTMIGSANFVLQSPNASNYGGMTINQNGSGLKPFYGYAVNGVTNCWTYFDQAANSWKLYNAGDRLTVDNAGNVGIGTTTPSSFLDIQAGTANRALNVVSNVSGSSGQIINFQRTQVPLSANDILQITVPAGSPDDFQFIEADVAGSNRFQVNGDGSMGVGISTISTARLNVDGTNSANKKLYGIYANADSATSASRAIFGEYQGTTADGVGVYGKSTAAAGTGYGVYGEGAYVGVRGAALGTTYTGTAYGLYGTASGSAGTRIGVYGSATGGTVNNWGGYFPTKVYASELRVGGFTGATGYALAVNGKAIAEEVRVELRASWPDYVFSDEYQLMPLEQLKKEIETNQHLPGIPSAAEMTAQGGIDLGDMQTRLVEKVEELTLYILQLKEQNDQLAKANELLQQRVSAIENK